MSGKGRSTSLSWVRIILPLITAVVSAGVIVSPRVGESARIDRMIAERAAEVERGRTAERELTDLRAAGAGALEFAEAWRRSAVRGEDDERRRYEYFRRIEEMLGISVNLCLLADGREQLLYGGGDAFTAPTHPPIRLESGLWARRLRVEAVGPFVGLLNFIEIVQFGPRACALRDLHFDMIGDEPRDRRVTLTLDWLLDPEGTGRATGDAK